MEGGPRPGQNGEDEVTRRLRRANEYLDQVTEVDVEGGLEDLQRRLGKERQQGAPDQPPPQE